jgi:hypothetical protein
MTATEWMDVDDARNPRFSLAGSVLHKLMQFDTAGGFCAS